MKQSFALAIASVLFSFRWVHGWQDHEFSTVSSRMHLTCLASLVWITSCCGCCCNGFGKTSIVFQSMSSPDVDVRPLSLMIWAYFLCNAPDHHQSKSLLLDYPAYNVRSAPSTELIRLQTATNWITESDATSCVDPQVFNHEMECSNLSSEQYGDRGQSRADAAYHRKIVMLSKRIY